MVASYSRLYEEGEVDHINDPHPPTRYILVLRELISKAEENGGYTRLYSHVASGRMGGTKSMNLIIELQISC